MKKLIFFLIILSSIIINCQIVNNEYIYVMIDYAQSENLFLFQKGTNNEYASIKILYYNERKKGFKRKKETNFKKDIIIVKAEPNDMNYYEFISNNYPKKVKNINRLKVYSIEDVSKNKKNVWHEYPYTIFFIEKLNDGFYNLWKMNPIIHE